MTTRGGMGTVAVTAMVAAALVGVERSRQRQDRYAAALRGYQTSKVSYEQGYVLLGRIVERSQTLLEAELALCWTKKAQAAAIEAHLTRASSLIQTESQIPVHKASAAHRIDIERANDSLPPWRLRLCDLLSPAQ